MQGRRIQWAVVVMATVLGGQLACANDSTTPPNAATKLSLVAAPSVAARNRIPFAIQPAVQLQDASGSAIAQAGTSVTAAISSGGGTLGGTTTVATDASGKATFTGLMITGIVGEKVLTFSASGLSATTMPVTLTAGAATSMAVSVGASQTAAAGTAVTTSPAVRVTDADGNAVAGVAVTFTAASGGGVVVGGSATTDAGGIARVTSWTLGGSPGANTLTATAAGLTGSPITFSATGTTAAGATLAKVAGDAQSAAVGTAVSIAPSVKVADAAGNGVAGATVTFAVASGGGSVTGGSQATNASGMATVGGWTLGSAAGANTLTASATGVTSVTFSATATAVTATTTMTFCNPTHATGLPIWFAYQNGASGVWTQLGANVDKSYTVPITSVGGISWVTRDGTSYEHQVIYAAKAELAGIGCLGPDVTGTKTITGSVAGVSATQSADIAFGSTSATVSGSTGFSITDAPDGARDLVASRGTETSSGSLPDRFIVRRGLNPASGATLPVLDFSSTEALAPAAAATYTLAGVGTESWFAGTFVNTANVTTALLGFAFGTGAGGSVAVPYQVLPASQRLGSDGNQFFGLASETGTESGPGAERGVIQNLTTFGNRSVTLGSALSVPVITTVATSPNVRMRMRLASQSAYSAAVNIHFFGPSPSLHDVFLTVTARYFDGTPVTWELTIPDLSSAGFQAAWGLQPAVAVGWNVQAQSALVFDRTSETPTFFAVRFDDSAFGGPARGAASGAAQRLPSRARWLFQRR